MKLLLSRSLFWLLGGIFLTLGTIGLFAPVLPTTPFILLTAACWAKASPRLHYWLRNHHYFGEIVRNWEERRAVPRRAKRLAYTMMTLSCLFLFHQFPDRWLMGVIISCICLATGIWLSRLPNQ